MKADTKLTVVMCCHIFDRSSVAPSSGDFRRKPPAPRRPWSDKSPNVWRCGMGVNIFLPTAVPVVCLSYCRPHGSEYHYDITVSDHTKWVIPHCHTFGFLSHHGRLGGGCLQRKSPLDGATDLLSKIWQHITTVSFVSTFIVVCSRKPKNTLGRV